MQVVCVIVCARLCVGVHACAHESVRVRVSGLEAEQLPVPLNLVVLPIHLLLWTLVRHCHHSCVQFNRCHPNPFVFTFVL